MVVLIDKSAHTKKDGVEFMPYEANREIYEMNSEFCPQLYDPESKSVTNYTFEGLKSSETAVAKGRPETVTVNGLGLGDVLMFQSRLFHRTSCADLDEGDVFKKALYLRFYPAKSTCTGLDLIPGIKSFHCRLMNMKKGECFGDLPDYGDIDDDVRHFGGGVQTAYREIKSPPERQRPTPLRRVWRRLYNRLV